MTRSLSVQHGSSKTCSAIPVIALFLGLSVLAVAQDNRYRSIRPPDKAEFRFPTPAATLNLTRTLQDEQSTRAHAWSLFASLIQPANPGIPTSLPTFQTWYWRDQDVSRGCFHFSSNEIPDLDPPVERLMSMAFFRNPQEKETARKALEALLEKEKRAGTMKERESKENVTGAKMASWRMLELPREGILYNREACEHIRSLALDVSKSGTDVSTLAALNTQLVQMQSPPQERDIPQFPTGSIVIKTAWRPTHDGDDVLYWDGQSFQDVTVLTKTGAPCDHLDGKTLPASCFYNVPVTDSNVKAINDSAQWGRELVVDDALLLMGLHIITKEVDDWTWSTFWWSNTPNDQLYGYDRPGPNQVPDPWRNYLMDATLSMVTPRGNQQTHAASSSGDKNTCPTRADDDPKTCFNPYLEGQDLSETNCMHCHKQAAYPAIHLDDTYSKGRGFIGSDAACFSERVRVDYLWSLSRDEKTHKSALETLLDFLNEADSKNRDTNKNNK